MPTNVPLTPILRQAVRWLKKEFPTKMPVTVKLLDKQPGLHGLCKVQRGRATITITLDTDTVMLESLLEEWVHVLRFNCPVPCEDVHDGIFWAILGIVTKKWRGE